MKSSLLKNVYDGNILNEDSGHNNDNKKLYGIAQYTLYGFGVYTKHLYISDDLKSVYEYFQKLVLNFYKNKHKPERFYSIYETTCTYPKNIKFKTIKRLSSEVVFIFVNKYKIKIYSDSENAVIKLLDNVDIVYDICKTRKDIKYMTKRQLKDYIKSQHYKIFLYKPKIKLVDSIMGYEIYKILLTY